MKTYEGKDNYYNLLGLKQDASLSEIKSRFRELAKQFHPDTYFHPSQRIWATRKFQQLVEAYETLSSPEKRNKYDESLTNKGIKVEETYDEKISKSVFNFWWSRIYIYLLPLLFSALFRGKLSLSLIEDLDLGGIALYVMFFVLLPWVMFSIFPPFWFVVSSRHTRNMGGLTIMLYIIGMMAGIGGVMSFIFNPGEYQEFLRHLPVSLELIILFYVVSIIVLFLVAWEVIKIKENVLFYQALTLGLIISTVCVIYSFKRSDWISLFIFVFYIATCLDFLINTISYERLRSKFDKKLHDTAVKASLSEE